MAEKEKSKSSECDSLLTVIDPLADKLGVLLPSKLSGLSEAIKLDTISSALSAATLDVTGLVDNAVDNFKDKLSGKLPELKIKVGEKIGEVGEILGDVGEVADTVGVLLSGGIPEISDLKELAAKYFDDIDDTVKDAIAITNVLKELNKDFKGKAATFLACQKNAIEDEFTRLLETASSMGDMLKDVAGNVSKISNVNLRDFDLVGTGAELLGEIKGEILDKVMHAAGIIAAKGLTIEEKAAALNGLAAELGVVKRAKDGGPIGGGTDTGESGVELFAQVTRYGYPGDPYQSFKATSSGSNHEDIGNRSNKLIQDVSIALPPITYRALSINPKAGDYVEAFIDNRWKKYRVDDTAGPHSNNRIDFYDPQGKYKRIDGSQVRIRKA